MYRRSTTCLLVGLAVLALAASACGRKDEGASVVRQLGVVKERLDDVDRDIRAIQPEHPTTQGAVRRWVQQVDKELPRYEPLEREALALQVKAEAVDDRDVGRAASLLVRMIDHRHDVTSHLVKTVEEARLGQQRPLLDLHRIEDEESKRMTERWEQLAKVLSERYAFV